jgi:hypothetical protein
LPAKVGQTPLRVFLQAFHGDRGHYTDTLQAQAIGCGSLPATNADAAIQLLRRIDERNPPVATVKRDQGDLLNELAHCAINGWELPDVVDRQPVEDFLSAVSDYAEFTGDARVSRIGCPHRSPLNHEVVAALRA